MLDLEDIRKNTGELVTKKRGIISSSNKNKFHKGWVLYSKLRPYLNKVLVADEDGVCTTEIVPINTKAAKVPLLAEYLQSYLMSPYFLSYANQLAHGVKMPRIGTKDAKAALVPIPPIKEQARIVQKLSNILKLISSADKSRQELKHLGDILKQQLLLQAIQGKLVPQLESEPDAKQIGVEPKEVPFVIPEKWKWRAFPVAVKNISAKSYQIKSSEVLRYGALPVVSQSKQRIDGYSNNKSKAIPTELLPIVIFGDHTRVTKYVNFPFIVGADGTKLLRPIHEDLTPEFLYFFVQFMSQQIRDRGYSRHFQFLKSTFVPIPPKQEQIRIVAKLKEIFDTVNAI